MFRLPGVSLTALLFATSLANAAPPTFNHDVAPIIYQNCSSCHRAGEAAPFPLMSYEDVKKKAKTIARETHSRAMPPWKADPGPFPFRDDRRLSDKDVATVQEWVKAGMPEGDEKEKPEPPKFASGWRLGEPDLVVEMPEPFHIPAEGADIYRNIAVPLGITEDKWVAAVDMQTSSRGVVHHVLYFADSTGKVHERPRSGTEPGFSGMAAGRGMSALGGWAVGGQPHFYPEGLALPLPKGSDLLIQYHFHPSGKPEVEKSRIGFYFAKKAPERTLTRIQMPPSYSLFSGLDIPAGEKDFVIRDSYTVPVDVDVIGMGAHAHQIAKRMKMTATFPDGSVKTLLSISDWDFAWQDSYYFKEPVVLPKDTKLDVEIHWDNSADNPRNPSSPPVRVTWGEESKDEMGSVSAIVVARDKAAHPDLRTSLRKRSRDVAEQRIKADPAMLLRLRKFLAE